MKKTMSFNKEISIGNRVISEDSRTFIVAEAGVNHNGDFNKAKELIDAACGCGVDAVKFQIFRTEELILENVSKAPYQKGTTGSRQSQFDMLKGLELLTEDFVRLKQYCDEKKILFLCTPFDEVSLKELDTIGVPAFKIAATDLTNIRFLRSVASCKKPVIISAGMCYMEEVRKALEAVYPINKDVILLQCTANYPLNDEEVNLNVIDTFKEEFDVLTGFSDHSVDIGASPFAVAKGAKLIEKHFTLDKNDKGPDHRASVDPGQLKQLVEDVRRVERYLGSGIKIPTYSEQFTRKSLQKCLVAAVDIRKGESFNEKNITAKRTGGVGISALYYDDMMQRTALADYKKDDIINE